MNQVRIVTDSTADLPAETTDSLGITVVPLNVHFGDDTYLDGVEMRPDDFFSRLTSSRQLPRTSQPSPEAFRKSYESLLPDATGILCITISSKLSGTYNSARLGAQDMQVPTVVIDSGSASMAAGFAVIKAAEAARSGASLEEVERLVRDQLQRTGILFYADTLEYLQKNGRIGRAAGLLGSLLEVKPVLTVREGEVEQYQRTRTRGKAIQALVSWVQGLDRPQEMAVIWSTNEADLNRLLDSLGETFPRDRILVTKYGPVIGAHLGPGAMGVIVVEGPA